MITPVLIVEMEPGYMSRGHYCEGTKSQIDPTKVWKLPVGTKLYTSTQVEQVRTLREGEIMGVYLEFDRHADPKWTDAEYLLKFGAAVSKATTEAIVDK